MKKIAIVVILVLLACLSYAVTQAELLSRLQKVTVQIVVTVTQYERPLYWYKNQYDGNQPKNADTGWKVRYGDWSQGKQIQVMGSGVIVYSNKWKNRYVTDILTNWHVIDLLVNEKDRGTVWNPIEVYDEKDIIKTSFPPGIKVKEGARPIKEMYYTIDKNYVSIKHREDQYYDIRAKIVGGDQRLDIAVLELEDVWGLPYATFAKEPAKVGQRIWVSGAPLGIPFSVDQGHVNQIHLDLGYGLGIAWLDQIKYDCPTSPGNSGSGLYNDNGELVGLVHGGLVYSGHWIEGGNLAIEGQDIQDWLIWNRFAYIVFQKPYWKEAKGNESHKD